MYLSFKLLNIKISSVGCVTFHSTERLICHYPTKQISFWCHSDFSGKLLFLHRKSPCSHNFRTSPVRIGALYTRSRSAHALYTRPTGLDAFTFFLALPSRPLRSKVSQTVSADTSGILNSRTLQVIVSWVRGTNCLRFNIWDLAVSLK